MISTTFINNNAIQQFYKWSVFIYLIFKPLYFFDSGIPQIADFLLLIPFTLFAFSINFKKLFRNRGILYLLLFFSVVSAVNLTYHFIDSDSVYSTSYIFAILYFGFNIYFFVFCFTVFKSFIKKDFEYLVYVIFIALAMEYVLLITGYDKGIDNDFKNRAYLSFNNPNQLSYYCLILSGITLFVVKKIPIKRYLVSLILSLSFVLIVCATSRPAIIGALILISLYYFVVCKKHVFKELLVFIIPILLFLVFNTEQMQEDFKRIDKRFAKVEYAGKTDLVERGFMRVVDNPNMLIYGAGEGNYERFVKNESLLSSEFHSAIGSVWFSYGLAGITSFGLFLFYIFKKLRVFDLITFLPILLYNLFHNGMRFSLLCFFLALLFAISTNVKQNIP
ncbi:hypothetical protein ULMA_22970 [Patiriisocius marinus]|uniref:O-antigen polymerase n=1 Tax=Patiriisocius marinus TaxID=1397112 RepID=A0A5J4IQX0_9FLAO|nr:O-antigen ligase family protein [Patiriisocius marinus]GER60189.1 hypothetical protein ULMA_22970 [Patiriisocius marinus]